MITFSIILATAIWLLPMEENRISEQRTVTQFAKFMAAIVVVLGHQVIFYCKTLPPNFSSEIPSGDLCVAFFLLMSGYGLMCGQLKKNEKLSLNWLKKRIPKLIVPALTAMTFYLIVATSLGKDIVWINVMKYSFLSHQNLPYGWYVTEILLLYLTFWIGFSYVKKDYALYFVSGMVCLAMGVMIIMQSPIWYIQGLPCFLMGLYLAYWEVTKPSVISSNIHKRISIKLFMSVMVVLLFLLSRFDLVQAWLPVLNKWRYMYVSFFAEKIVFIGILVYLLMRLPNCNKIFNLGGEYFYEIYLVQGGTLMFCRKLIQNDWLFLLIGMIVTIMVAKWMSLLNGWLLKRL